MNKRIEELAKQAVFECYQEGCISQNEKVMEKFAELIIMKCADIAEVAEPYKADDLILKHFGLDR